MNELLTNLNSAVSLPAWCVGLLFLLVFYYAVSRAKWKESSLQFEERLTYADRRITALDDNNLKLSNVILEKPKADK